MSMFSVFGEEIDVFFVKSLIHFLLQGFKGHLFNLITLCHQLSFGSGRLVWETSIVVPVDELSKFVTRTEKG